MEKTCSNCGNKFLSLHHSRKYCSVSCADTVKKNARNEKDRMKYEDSSTGFREKERERLSKYNSRDRKEYLQNYRDTKRFGFDRRAIIERDGNKCVKCGETEKLHVHHKDFSGQTDNPNNTASNLITLCATCHGLAHQEERRKGKTIQCGHCGKDIYVKTRFLKTKKHCSKECQAEAKKLEIATTQMRNCIVCGVEFREIKQSVDAGRGQYCSKKCNGIGVRKRIVTNCQHCNKEFEVGLAQHNRGKGKFCSKPCYYKAKALS